jgi:hypothetical protein
MPKINVADPQPLAVFVLSSAGISTVDTAEPPNVVKHQRPADLAGKGKKSEFSIVTKSQVAVATKESASAAVEMIKGAQHSHPLAGNFDMNLSSSLSEAVDSDR